MRTPIALLLALGGALALPACTPLEAESPGLPDLGGLLEDASREEATRAIAEALGIEMVDEEGEPWGEVVIDEQGIAIYNAEGELAMRLDPAGSLHNVPEVFNRELTLNGGLVLPTHDGGELVFGAHTLGALLQELAGGMGERPDAPREIRTGSITPDSVLTGKVELPLAGGGSLVLDDSGAKILNDKGVVVWSVDEKGSKHAIPEEFAGGIVVPMLGGGKITLGSAGFEVEDKDGNLRGLINAGGTLLYGEVMPETLTTKKVTVAMDGGHKLISDKDGLRIVDNDGKVLWSVDESGSKHNVPEEFAGGITIPLNSGGKVTITEVGIEILDKDGNLRGLAHDAASMWYGPVYPENVITKSVTIGMDGEHELISDKDGLRIVDKDGKVLWSVDESGSKHNIPETFSEIRMPLIDDDGKAQGTMVMDREGLWIQDTSGKIVYALDERASMHLMPEEFSTIIVPQKDGTKLVIDENGLHREDKDGKTIPEPVADTPREVAISTGVALDTAGREIIFDDPLEIDLEEFSVEYDEEGEPLRVRTVHPATGCLPTGKGSDLCLLPSGTLAELDIFGEVITTYITTSSGCMETSRKTLLCLPPLPTRSLEEG